ncbi:hypothetical protein P154DRAFT_323007 [Amniculicola lignicola CBS 123094]|uniref:Uncharacterized protein n=1 Tax=Amniculicola lignicola CBS 123094 TaxID=1392246 RepID=A0A6A5W3D4_9PLEO|nr:hypothetical protein P154DRAFT_323007 [Amniculicola lignicola CBS 123094]
MVAGLIPPQTCYDLQPHCEICMDIRRSPQSCHSLTPNPCVVASLTSSCKPGDFQPPAVSFGNKSVACLCTFSIVARLFFVHTDLRMKDPRYIPSLHA